MMKLTAQRLSGEQPVCQMRSDEKSGTMKVKPTTFNAGVNVEASVLCPVCDCEKVETQINADVLTLRVLAPIYEKFMRVFLLSVPQTPLKKAARCYGNGDLVCGKCQCHDDW